MVMQESLARLLSVLGDEQLRQIALGRMEGYSNAEIAGRLGSAVGTVERRLRLIRLTWQDLAGADEETAPEKSAPGEG
jgi:DNA-directed RNA polymerase specialized sigma24 family protein